MKAILEQNFDELYAQAKARIEACVVPVEQMTTFTFFVVWNTINQILIDVFSNTRFMWNICGSESDNELKIRFLDQFKTVSTNEIVVEIRKTFKLISFDEFCRMSHDEMCKYEDLCQNHGYSCIDLSRHFGKSDGYVYSIMSARKSGRISRLIKCGSESMVIRETLKRINDKNIPLCSVILRNIFPKHSPAYFTCIMTEIRNGERCDAYIDADIEKTADERFIEYIRILKLVVISMIHHDTESISSDRTYRKGVLLGIGRSMHLSRIQKRRDGRCYSYYKDESLEKLKQLQSKLEQITTTANKGGQNGSVQ